MVQFFYIRHGQSVWNLAQTNARKAGQSELAVRKLGDEAQFTDAPLTEKGILQALSLRQRLFASPPEGALAKALQCAVAQACAPPQVYTSNLRRAVDTGILALRPLLVAESASDTHVVALPAMQETCHYADCVPLPVTAGGTLEPVRPSRAPHSASPSSSTTASEVLMLQTKAIEAEHPAELDFLIDAYTRRLRLAPHATFDDRRRLADGLSLTGVSALPLADFRAAIRPLEERVGDILSAALGASGDAAAAAARPAILAAHSRLLREILFLFLDGRLSAPIRIGESSQAVEYALRWDRASNANECALLAGDTSRISNCGIVAFDLDVCGGTAPGDCEGAPTITLRRCLLDAGSTIVARTVPPSPPSHGGAIFSSMSPHALELPVVLIGAALLISVGLALRRLLKHDARTEPPKPPRPSAAREPSQRTTRSRSNKVD